MNLPLQLIDNSNLNAQCETSTYSNYIHTLASHARVIRIRLINKVFRRYDSMRNVHILNNVCNCMMQIYHMEDIKL